MNGLSYFIPVRDGALWLVVEVLVDGDAAVLGRWTEKADAEAECQRWAELAAAS